MGQNLDLRGPGTAMAFSAGLAAYGAGVGDLRNEFLILVLFGIAPILIEVIHVGGSIVDERINGD